MKSTFCNSLNSTSIFAIFNNTLIILGSKPLNNLVSKTAFTIAIISSVLAKSIASSPSLGTANRPKSFAPNTAATNLLASLIRSAALSDALVLIISFTKSSASSYFDTSGTTLCSRIGTSVFRIISDSANASKALVTISPISSFSRRAKKSNFILLISNSGYLANSP